MSRPGGSSGVRAQLDPDNPWPGLEAFDEEARDYFHGRETEAQELLRRVTESSLTVLFGKSGLGKTSLLKAGLFPRLRATHFLPVYVRLDIHPQARSCMQQITDQLRATIDREHVDGPAPGPDESLWVYLHRAGLELWSAQNHLLTPILVVDQFEELFTLGDQVPSMEARFRTDLGDLAENRIPPTLAAALEQDEAEARRLDLHSMRYKVLISLREDFLPELEGWCRDMPSLTRARVRLLRMRQEQALAAVYQAGVHLMDEALARRIVQFIATAQSTDVGQSAGTSSTVTTEANQEGGEIEPALLSLFCRGLNERRKREGKPRFDEGLIEGAGQGIIADYYRSCLEGMPLSVSRFIENELITERGFRNSYARDDAVPSQMTAAQLDRLINLRLLRLEERYGAQRIELTHDLLTRTVREERDRRRAEEEQAALARRAEEEQAALARRAEEEQRALKEQARQREAQLEAERRAEREQRLEAEVQAGRRYKRLARILALVAIMVTTTSMIAAYQWRAAREQRGYALEEARSALVAREEAETQGKLAKQRLDRITDGIRMKQAVLAGDSGRIDAYLNSDFANHSIAFTASADSLGYRDPQGRKLYRFSLFPKPESLPTGEEAVAFITYRMDHPSFQNALLATGPDRDFKASYTGWGCLAQVVALIEYANPDRSPEISVFNMCAAIPWKL